MFLRIVGARSAEQFDIIEVKTCAIILTCITYYIYAYHDFLEKLRCSYNSAKSLAKSSTDAALEAMHTGMYALLRWQMYRIPFAEFLEQLASDNGADMHKYNTLYTRTLN